MMHTCWATGRTARSVADFPEDTGGEDVGGRGEAVTKAAHRSLKYALCRGDGKGEGLSVSKHWASAYHVLPLTVRAQLPCFERPPCHRVSKFDRGGCCLESPEVQRI